MNSLCLRAVSCLHNFRQTIAPMRYIIIVTNKKIIPAVCPPSIRQKAAFSGVLNNEYEQSPPLFASFTYTIAADIYKINKATLIPNSVKGHQWESRRIVL
uniref:Uncharacterized protein n=1 Tax=Micrurus lemniscatus lemniscatus TaxID=129467 RepID=A0A2D4HQF9_MICLE